MRLIVARCEVAYTGRLSAYLPESTLLLFVKDDGAALVHADHMKTIRGPHSRPP